MDSFFPARPNSDLGLQFILGESQESWAAQYLISLGPNLANDVVKRGTAGFVPNDAIYTVPGSQVVDQTETTTTVTDVVAPPVTTQKPTITSVYRQTNYVAVLKSGARVTLNTGTAYFLQHNTGHYVSGSFDIPETLITRLVNDPIRAVEGLGIGGPNGAPMPANKIIKLKFTVYPNATFAGTTSPRVWTDAGVLLVQTPTATAMGFSPNSDRGQAHWATWHNITGVLTKPADHVHVEYSYRTD